MAPVLVQIIEDDTALVSILRDILEQEGYVVWSAMTGRDALAQVREQQPDLIILDLGLPDVDGLLLIGALRAQTAVPIVVLSARQTQADAVLSLKLGADDFIAKPFDVDDLEARISAVLRRSARPDVVRVGDLVITPLRHTASLGGVQLQLSPTEYRLLTTFASHAGELLSQEALGLEVWGYEDTLTQSLIKTHINRLRSKMQTQSPASSAYVFTARGRGYGFTPGRAH